MFANRSSAAIPQKQLLRILGLIALSTLLFVVGILAERQGERAEPPGAHVEPLLEATSLPSRESQESGETHNENAETLPHEGETSKESIVTVANEVPEAPHSETILGIDLESPWLIAAAVIIWVILAAALARLGYPVLPIIIVVALAMLVFDVLEVIRNVSGQPNWGIAAVALLVVLTRAAIAVVSFQALRTHSRPA